MILGILKFLRENIKVTLEKIIKTIKLSVERTFLRYKWINKSHFALASLVNVLNNSAQISDPVKKIEKFKQKGEYIERILKNYKNTLYKKYKGNSINLYKCSPELYDKYAKETTFHKDKDALQISIEYMDWLFNYCFQDVIE